MTIGLGFLHAEGVLIASDGVASLPYDGGAIDATDVCKIYQLGQYIFCVAFGLEPLYLPAVDTLRRRDWDSDDKATISQIIRSSVEWSFKIGYPQMMKMSGKPTLLDEVCKAALLVGGDASDGAFVTSAISGHNTNSPSRLFEDAEGSYFLIGGEGAGSQTIFTNTLKNHQTVLEYSRVNSQAALDSFVRTVRQVEQFDKSIGGTVRFVNIRKGVKANIQAVI